jgi:hypothetical protein
MKIDKNLQPIVAGLVTVFVWATMICIVSAVYGPLGNCAGIHVGHYVVGKVSRYWDPFLFGVLVGFIVFAWQHQPPSFSKKKLGEMFVRSEIGVGFLINTILFMMFIVYQKNYGRHGIPIIFFFYGIMLLTPFGLRGVTASSLFVMSLLWIVYGLPATMTFFFAVWLGKWAIWWMVNIIRLGFRDTCLKLKGKLSPDHGGEGTDILQELNS